MLNVHTVIHSFALSLHLKKVTSMPSGLTHQTSSTVELFQHLSRK